MLPWICVGAFAQAPDAAFFEAKIRPMLVENCLRCHGPEKPKSHFRLTSRAAALKGGDNNSDDIVPGNSAKSRRNSAVTSDFIARPESAAESCLRGVPSSLLRRAA